MKQPDERGEECRVPKHKDHHPGRVHSIASASIPMCTADQLLPSMMSRASFGNSKIGGIARTPFSKPCRGWMKIEPWRCTATTRFRFHCSQRFPRKDFSGRRQIERQLSYFREAIGGSCRSIQIEMTRPSASNAITLQRVVIDAEIQARSAQLTRHS
jgi:hypothetical protein